MKHSLWINSRQISEFRMPFVNQFARIPHDGKRFQILPRSKMYLHDAQRCPRVHTLARTWRSRAILVPCDACWERTEVLGPSAGASYTRQRWREHGPRFGGNCPTRVVPAYVSKTTTLRMLSMYLCLSVYEYVLSTVFDHLILAAYSLGRRISKIVAGKLRLSTRDSLQWTKGFGPSYLVGIRKRGNFVCSFTVVALQRVGEVTWLRGVKIRRKTRVVELFAY